VTIRSISSVVLATAGLLVFGCSEKEECTTNADCADGQVCWSNHNSFSCQTTTGLEACCEATKLCGFVGCADVSPGSCSEGDCPIECNAKATKYANCLIVADSCETEQKDRCERVIDADRSYHSFCTDDSECDSPLICDKSLERCDTLCSVVNAGCNEGGSVNLPALGDGTEASCTGQPYAVAQCISSAGPLMFPCPAYAACEMQNDCGCSGKECGADTCGGTCGTCTAPLACSGSRCALDGNIEYAVVFLSGTVDQNVVWDRNAIPPSAAPPDPHACLHIGNPRMGGSVTCIDAEQNTYTPTFNVGIAGVSASALLAGVRIVYDDEDDFVSDDNICDFNHTFTEANLRNGDEITLTCPNGSLRLKIAL